MRRFFLWIMLVLALAFPALAEKLPVPEGLRVVLTAEEGTAEVLPTETADGIWLFLPAFAENVQAQLDGKELQIEKNSAEDDTQNWRLYRDDETVASLRVMQGDTLRALFLFSDDPDHYGRSYIEESPEHKNVASGSFALVNAEGKTDHAGRLQQIRGRGNGTWEDGKRPYQIKLSQEMNLLDTGNPEESRPSFFACRSVSRRILPR